MKSIYEKFTDKEFAELKEAKKKRSWHDFIMLLTRWVDTQDNQKEVNN